MRFAHLFLILLVACGAAADDTAAPDADPLAPDARQLCSALAMPGVSTTCASDGFAYCSIYGKCACPLDAVPRLESCDLDACAAGAADPTCRELGLTESGRYRCEWDGRCYGQANAGAPEVACRLDSCNP